MVKKKHSTFGGKADIVCASCYGMKYTFTLRDGLRWHDGQPVLSEDCVESLKRGGARLAAAAIVTRQRLESIGFKVILKAMSWWSAADVSNPAVHFGVSGAGPRAWFGWPDLPQLDNLVTDWCARLIATEATS